MTVALSRHHPGAVVDAVSVVLRDDGTNKRARLALTYSAGSGPATVFAKAVDPDHAELVALTSGLYHEPRLFTSGVELPLDHPTVYTALIDENRSDFLMIMEDVVARGADPRDSTRPMSIDQVAKRCSRARPNAQPVLGRAPRHVSDARLARTVRRIRGHAVRAVAHRPRAARRNRGARDSRRSSGTELFVDIWARYIGTLTRSTQTLLHGDPHIGNTYVLPDNEVGFLDWQMARRGNWSLDLGYFLQGALTIEDRRRR